MVCPTPETLDESLRNTPSNPELWFGAGQWAEYYGLDQQWHLALIRRVVARAPLEYRPEKDEDPKWEYAYDIGRDVNIPPYYIRASEEALKRAFGLRPFVFLQWALLRTEALVQFKENHQRDFAALNFGYTAEQMWNQFLNHEANKDFKTHFDSFPTNTQEKLLGHLFSTFNELNRLSKASEVSIMLSSTVSATNYENSTK
jgi:hypothetical protein